MSSSDWPSRKAAAEALKAFAVALGPGLDSPGPAAAPAGALPASARAAEALERCRFDKVKPVRDAVQEAQAVLLDLQVLKHVFFYEEGEGGGLRSVRPDSTWGWQGMAACMQSVTLTDAHCILHGFISEPHFTPSKFGPRQQVLSVTAFQSTTAFTLRHSNHCPSLCLLPIKAVTVYHSDECLAHNELESS